MARAAHAAVQPPPPAGRLVDQERVLQTLRSGGSRFGRVQTVIEVDRMARKLYVTLRQACDLLGGDVGLDTAVYFQVRVPHAVAPDVWRLAGTLVGN